MAASRAAASSSGSPAASPRTRRSRCAAGWSTPAPTWSPVMTAGRAALRRRDDVLGAGVRAGAVRRCGTRTTPIPHTRLGQAADLVRRLPGHRPPARHLRRGHLRRPADRHPARHPGAGASSARRCTPRCGSTRRCRTTSRLLRAGACTSSPPAEGRLAGGDVGTGRLADPATHRRAVERVLAPATLAGAACASSPPAAPASPSTPCASSATAPRASRATPWPRRPRPGAPRSRSSPPSTGPVAAGVDAGARWRPRRDARRRARPRADGADVVVDGGRGGRLPAGRAPPTEQDQEGTPACPRSCSSRPPTSSPPLGARKRAGPGRGRLRGGDRPTCGPTPATSSRRKGADLIVANDVSAPQVGFEHDTNEVVILVRARRRRPDGRRRPRSRCRCPTSSVPRRVRRRGVARTGPVACSGPSPDGGVRPRRRSRPEGRNPRSSR